MNNIKENVKRPALIFFSKQFREMLKCLVSDGRCRSNILPLS